MRCFFGWLLLLFAQAGAAQQIVDTIPFSLDATLITFAGKINDQDVLFAFDTGASMGVINSTDAQNTGVSSHGKIKINDSNKNKTAMKKVAIAKVEVGHFVLNNHDAVQFDMPHLFCNHLFLLGADVINKLNWQFDFEKKLVLVSKDSFAAGQQMQVMPVSWKKNRHFTNFRMEAMEVTDCLVDFGYSGVAEAEYDEPVFKKLLQNKKAAVTQSLVSNMGLGSTSVGQPQQNFIADSMQLGSFCVSDIPVAVNEHGELKIGLGFFRLTCSKLIINSSSKKYYLQRLKNQSVPQEFDVKLLWQDGKILVAGKSLAGTSTASQLEIMEEIKSVNGRAAASFADECAFITWRLKINDSAELLIEKMNGQQLVVKKACYINKQLAVPQ
jgi:hypothetical protein